MIEKVMKALTDRDSKAFAACFAPFGEYIDYCPSLNGRPNIYLYGNQCMDMYFGQQFSGKSLKAAENLAVADPVIESKDCANYFGAYGGPYIYARLHIVEYDSDGLIKKAVVYPA